MTDSDALVQNLRVTGEGSENSSIFAKEHLEQDLQNALALQQAIMANANCGLSVVTIDDDNRIDILFANEKFYSMQGFTKAQYEKEVSDSFGLIVSQDRARVQADVCALLHNGGTSVLNYRSKKRDGSIIHQSVSASAVSLVGMEKRVFIGVSIDQTQEKALLQKMSRNDEQFRIVVSNIASGVTAVVLRDDNNVEPIMLTDKYYSLLGYTKEQFEQEVDDLFSLIHPDDRAQTVESVYAFQRKAETGTLSFRVKRRDGQERWLNVVVSTVQFAGIDESVQLGVFTDITEQKQNEIALREADEQLQFHNEMTKNFLSRSDIEDSLNQVIENLRIHFGGNRCYIFEINDDTQLASNTYEKCADGVTSEMDNLQSIPLSKYAIWRDTLEKDNYLSIEDVDSLPDERSAERALLQAQSIKKLIAVTLRRDSKPIGFIGIDDPSRKFKDFTHLQAFSDYLSVMLSRRDMKRQIERDNISLRMREREFAYALSQMGTMLCQYDISTQTLTVPDDYAALYGLSTGRIEHAPQCIISGGMIDEESLPEYQAFFNAIIRGEEIGTMNYAVRRQDGSRHWERASFSTIFSQGGQPVKALISVEDTTKQHLQYELERNRPIFGKEGLLEYAVFNLSCDGEILEAFDQDGKPIAPEDRIRSFSKDNRISTAVFDENVQLEYRALYNIDWLLSQYKDGMTTHSIEFRKRLKNGESRWVRNDLYILERPDGDDILLFEYVYDIEEEKLQQLTLGKLISEGYDYVARVNVKNHKFRNVVKSVGSFGLPSEQEVDYDNELRRMVSQYVHVDDREMTLFFLTVGSIKAQLAKQERLQLMVRACRSDGSIRNKKVTAYYLDRTEEFIIVAIADITDAIAEALKLAESASDAKTRFISNMSHEIRTPMNAITNLVDFAMEDIDNPKKLREHLKTIHDSSDHLLMLINNMLDITRIESGKIELAHIPFDLSSELDRLKSIVQSLCEERKQHLITDFSGIKTASVIGDQLKVSQILMNLLSNAIKFTPIEGTVRFMATEIASLKETFTCVRITVEDTGMGISEDLIQHVFEPFVREDSKRVSTIQGTGLGLAICHRYVLAMGGTIHCESKLNQGTVFTVELPFQAVNKTDYTASTAPDALEPSPFAGLRCLLCEDHPINQKIAVVLLKKYGFSVETANDGQEGFRMFASSKPGYYSVIYMDVQMPVMDGYEATLAIRNSDHADARSVPIIAVTADVFTEAIERTRLAGMNGHIPKPISVVHLVKETKRVLSKKE